MVEIIWLTFFGDRLQILPANVSKVINFQSIKTIIKPKLLE